jgi:hypothetical protein
MKQISNWELTEKAVILAVILSMIVAGVMYREDFSSQPVLGIVWFTILGLAASRLIYFLIRNK